MISFLIIKNVTISVCSRYLFGQLLSDAATIPNGFVIGMFMICDLSVTLFNNNNMVA